jgi:outer membrane receptor protein involved in Fe transport
VDGITDPGVNGQRTDRLNDLNPDDIESVEVVKGDPLPLAERDNNPNF